MSKEINYGWLKDYDDNKFVPITHSTKVFDDNGNTVESRVSNVENAIPNLVARKAFSTINTNGVKIDADSAEDELNFIQGNGINITGDATNDNVTISHADTSNASNVTSKIGNPITGITLDNFGHITATETNPNAKLTVGNVEYNGTEAKTVALKNFGIDVTADKINYLDGAEYNIQIQLNKKFSDVETGSTEGSIKLLAEDSSVDKEVTINGLGHTGDGKFYFIDNQDKVIAIVSETGVKSLDFTTEQTTLNTLKGELDDTNKELGDTNTALAQTNTRIDELKYAGSSTTGGSATSAEKVNNALSIGGKTFDGSQPINISLSDLGLTGALVYLGVSTTQITDNGTQKPTINGKEIATSTLSKGAVVFFNNQEFVWTGSKWEILGDEGSYALKTIQIKSGDGLTGSGTLATDVTISHADTSNLTGAQNAGTNKALTSITVDKFGHITATGSNDVVTSINITSNENDTTQKNGTFKYSVNGGTALEVQIKGLGESADGNHYFIDNQNNVIASITGLGVKSIDFITEDTTLNTLKNSLGSAAYTDSSAYDSAGSANTALNTAKALINGLHKVASSGNYNDLTNKPSAYTLPTASSSTLGGVKIGNGLSIVNNTGILSVDVVNNLTSDSTTKPLSAAQGKALKIAIDNVSGDLGNLGGGDMMKATYDTDNDGIVDNAKKLNGQEASYYLNYNNLTNKPSGYTLPNATSSTLGGVKIGSNISIDNGTISLSKANVTNALGYTPPTTNTTYSVVSTTADGLAPKRDGSTTKYLRADGTWAVPPDTNTTYSAATQSAAGLMSANDKKKLDGIANNANNYTYTLPNATSSVLGGVKIGSNISISSGTISLTKANVTSALGYTPPTTNTTYGEVTTTTAGLMSAADKVKLNGIANNANNYTYTLPTASETTLGGIKIGNGFSIDNGVLKANQETKYQIGIEYGSGVPTDAPESGEGSIYIQTGGDAVVEKGTSGIWTYRKWASGIAECWGKFTCFGVTATSAWGSMYESSNFTLADYPFTFTEIPTQNVSVISTGGSAFFTYVYGSYGPTTTSAGSVNFYRPTSSSSSQNVTLSIQTIGRWK